MNAHTAEKTIEINLVKLISVFVGAILSTFVGAVYLTLRTLNADHFTLATLGGRVDALEETYVPRNEFVAVEKRLDRIENKLDTLLAR